MTRRSIGLPLTLGVVLLLLVLALAVAWHLQILVWDDVRAVQQGVSDWDWVLLVLGAGVLGVDARLLLLAPPLFVVGAIAGLVGLALSSYASEFTRYLMVAMLPAVAIFQAPILSYFGVVPPFAFAWIPTDPALSSFAMLAHRELDAGRYLLDALRLAVFLVLAWAWALACFRERIRARPEEM